MGGAATSILPPGVAKSADRADGPRDAFIGPHVGLAPSSSRWRSAVLTDLQTVALGASFRAKCSILF